MVEVQGLSQVHLCPLIAMKLSSIRQKTNNDNVSFGNHDNGNRCAGHKEG